MSRLRPLRSYWIVLQYNFEITQRIRRDFSSCLLTRKVLRINVAGTILSPARKFSGSYLCTMRATSEIFAADATRECFEYDFVYELSRSFCRLSLWRYSIGCATAIPMGVAPEIVLYCFAMEDNLKNPLTLHMLIEEICAVILSGARQCSRWE